MKKPINLKLYKENLRATARKRRNEITIEERNILDKKIQKWLLGMSDFRNAKTIFIYVSNSAEVSTISIIEQSLKLGKNVAVPRCVPNSRNMNFYLIKNLSELTPGSYGILEPPVSLSKKARSFADSFCVVPALCCDIQGFRIGYGGGYYDRFLNSFKGKTAIIIYKEFLSPSLLHGRFDISADFIISEDGVLSTAK